MTTTTDYQARATEEQMRDAIKQTAELQGGRIFWIEDSRRAPMLADWVDLIVVLPRRGVVALIELKSHKRPVMPGQAALMADLQQCHRLEAFTVRAGEAHLGEVSYDDLMHWLEVGQ